MRRRKEFLGSWRQYGKYVVCIVMGILFWMAAEFMDSEKTDIESGILRRNPIGQGEASYEFYVEGVADKEIPLSVDIQEQRPSEEKVRETLPDALELLYERMRGMNESLFYVTEDLKLDREIPEYGLSVRWESEAPEIIDNTGMIGMEAIPKEGKNVHMRAELSCGDFKDYVEIPVTVFPKEMTDVERFQEQLDRAVLQSATESVVRLPEEFEGRPLKYRSSGSKENGKLLFLGILASACLWWKERSDKGMEKKRREESLIRDYPELISRFLVLIGAGYPVKQVWKKQVEDHLGRGQRQDRDRHPVYEEMRITLNQMDTGMPEVQAYGEFGRRLGLRCYMKFSSLLESCVYTGGKDLRKLLESEMEEAFRQRADLAKRKGEEASTKLLFPMFLMLGIVIVMIVAPAFLTLG